MNSSYSRFKSNFFGSGLGFKIKYESIPLLQMTFIIGACGGYSKSKNGVFTSPFYPNVYPKNADCVYRISQQNGTFINLTVEVFDIEDGTDSSCSYDSLEIRDGGSEDSPMIGKFCGTNIPSSLISTDSSMWIR